MKKLLYALFLCLFSSLSLYSQITDITTTCSIGISCSEYVNNMNRTWNIDIPGNRLLLLTYQVRVEHSYDKILIYSINNAGTAVLQTTLTGSQSGTLYSLYPNGKMRVVFTSDISVNCSTNPTYSGFSINISKETEIVYEYDAAGNRTNRRIVLAQNAPLRSDTGEEEEIVFSEKIGYWVDRERLEADVRIYPNPTEGQLAVTIDNVPDNLPGQIYLLDTKGKLIEKRTIQPERKMDFDLSHTPAGIYILNIQLGENVSTWKIIKK